MKKKISIDLPTTSNDDDGNEKFCEFISEAEIECNVSESIKKYQGVSEDVGSCSDEVLNHCLALIHYGEDSQYANEFSEVYGLLSHNEYEGLLADMEVEFQGTTYSFTESSKVYKGLSIGKPYYKFLGLTCANEGDIVTFPGYLSTTVSEDKARTFATGVDDLMLTITGLQNARCIVPESAAIVGAQDHGNPEQEILLDKGTTLKVIKIDKQIYHLAVQA
ncbi:TPA: hypothetical protein NGU14_004455 [Vibrio parahaemolyticus]|nr:hypothetical protein [Vibrio parahaemolyticus]HCG8456149.1 hypothetical protein [Vibrio parahaemolyticus]